MRCVSPSPWSSSVRDTCTLSSDYPRLFVFWLWWWSSPRCGPPRPGRPVRGAPPILSANAVAWPRPSVERVRQRECRMEVGGPWQTRTAVRHTASMDAAYDGYGDGSDPARPFRSSFPKRPGCMGPASVAVSLQSPSRTQGTCAEHARARRRVPGFVSNYAGPGLASASTWAWITGPRTGPAWTSGLAPASLLHMLPPKMHGHVTSPVCYR
jgi:hypothetical protein